ncbi:MAG: M28 family metallopeptidase, partial [Clostridia bacterium]|nr:M28 family metallopeptidase [Clostridia bacterium]
MIKTFRQNMAFLLAVVLLFAPLLAFRTAAGEEGSLLYILCEPIYEGRGIGTDGNHLAAMLLAERMRDYGLVPLAGCPDFLLPFEQSVAGNPDTMLIAVMEDGSREELVHGRDYLFAGAGAAISGTYPVTRNQNEADPSVILLFDRDGTDGVPPFDVFAAMGYPVDNFLFNSTGINDKGSYYVPPTPPRIRILRPVYNRIAEAVSLETRYEFTKTVVTLQNVVGVLPGGDRTKAVILSAHFDGVGDQAGIRLPCALDNASGAAVLDEVLKRMAGTVPPYDVIFAFTNAEEAGLTGTYNSAPRLPRLYDDLYNINVDSVGLEGASFPMGAAYAGYPLLYEMLESCLMSNGFTCVQEGYYSGSDHDAFGYEGIPSAILINENSFISKYMHTAGDVPGNINPVLLTGLAGTIQAFITENPDIHALLARSKREHHDGHDEDVAAEEPVLAYHEAMLLDDHMYIGSDRWMTLSEALYYHPSLPIPERYKGCTLQACRIELFDLNAPQPEPGKIITLQGGRQDVMSIHAIYSDGTISYSLRFFKA